MISFIKHIGLIRRKGFLLLIMTLLVLLLSIFFVLSSSIQPKNQVDTQALEKRIRSLGELNTIEYRYQNLLKYEDTKELKGFKLPFTTKSLILLYEGYVKAGVDLKDIVIEVHPENHITIYLRNAHFTNNVIYEDSVKVYDEKSGLFNPLKLEEVFQLLDKEKYRLEQSLKEDGFLEEANLRTKKLVTPLLEEMGFEDILIEFH